jgi:hemerythrin-like domain-containing protein
MERIMADSQALEDLRAEHRDMLALLDMLQKQVEIVAQDHRPDGAVLLEIAEYFASVPDLFHHPKEDLILRRLAALDQEASKLLRHLEVEHEDGGRELKRFLRAVVRLLMEPDVDPERFLSAALAFMDIERRHIAWEEASFFPVVEAAFGSEDWTEIDSGLQSFIDPLHRKELPSRFPRLQQVVDAWRSPEP